MADQPTVFISYSRQDSKFVQRLIHDLETAGVSAWIDQQKLKVGTPDWQRAVRSAIRDANAVVLVVSPDSAESRYVQAELDIAQMYERLVFPVWIAGDGRYGEYVPFELMRAQYLDARGDGYAKALLELCNTLQNIEPVPVDAMHKLPPRIPDFEPRNPYKGLRAFTGADAGDFFGRESFVSELVETLKGSLGKDRFLAIVGPSGSGKSSVVMAGLIPRLRAGALSGSEKWIYPESVLPGLQPLEALAIVLADVLHTSIGSVLDDLDRSARGLHLVVKRLAKQRESRVLLLVDQFEELFTQTMDADKRDHFIDLLVTAATEPEGQTIIVITLRADFYDRPLNDAHLGKLLENHTKNVLPMTMDDLRAVIEKPAALADVQLEFEPGLVGDLLFEVREQVGALPLLQFTLDQLTEKRQDLLLTTAAYRDLGGVRGALAKHAEATYENLPSDAHREMTRTLFLRLIDTGATEQSTTRRRTLQSEVATPEVEKTRILREVSEAFTHARLLTVEKDIIEVSHEALLREWPRLGEWIQAAQTDLHLLKQVTEATQEWKASGFLSAYRWPHERLEPVYAMLRRLQIEPNSVLQAFIKPELDFLFEEFCSPQTTDYRRWALADRLVQLGDASLSGLIQALYNKNERVRRAAVEALAQMGKIAIPELLKALREKNPDVSDWAAEALRQIGSESVSGLIEVLRDTEANDERVRYTTVWTLSRIGATSIPDLLDVLRDGNRQVRIMAAEALIQIRLDSVPGLIQALNDSDKHVQRTAAWALEHIRGSEALSALSRWERDNPV